MGKYTIKPKVVRGGKAIPLGNNFYYMKGLKHEQGGIDIGADDKNGLEVEGGEVVHASKNSLKVFSAVPMLDGKSPAEKVINGENANQVFKEQEEFKDRNNYNDDGSKKYKNGGNITLFRNLQTTNNRGYEIHNLNYIYRKLKNSKKFNDKQIAVILANIVEESGANPYAKRDSGDTGLLQWVNRYKGIDKNRLPLEELDNQINYIIDTSDNISDTISWHHGGDKSGYNKSIEAYNEFANSDDLNRINYAFSMGYVRPKGKQLSASNRAKVAKQIYKELESYNRLNENFVELPYEIDKDTLEKRHKINEQLGNVYNVNKHNSDNIKLSSFFKLGGNKYITTSTYNKEKNNF